ncbi:uncharacterized protein B0H18DRAFT_284904 [Fomitopsis serialis]|uniref:uncharacterized protein n=1 Tax=Fomitopsis serialis TaxID=139415 RepID=UPI0020087E28|nr:uncharacterized protein B0H18DRAFT_284904 [Neoantrodia serialis]KAH9927691.1 hypothetical protein B0H18DRAFT_284904 [Neoantrodia serialis]
MSEHLATYCRAKENPKRADRHGDLNIYARLCPHAAPHCKGRRLADACVWLRSAARPRARSSRRAECAPLREHRTVLLPPRLRDQPQERDALGLTPFVVNLVIRHRTLIILVPL